MIIIVSLAGIGSSLYLSTQQEIDPEGSKASEPKDGKYTMRERFGVGGKVGYVNKVNNPLGMGWFFNWYVSDSNTIIHTHNMAVDYMPVIGVWNNEGYPGDGTSKSCDQYKTDFANNPYVYHNKTNVIIGNEIGWDMKYTPQQYALAFNAWKNCFRSFNPNIKVGSAAMLWEHTLAGGKVGKDYFIEFVNILRNNYGGDTALPDFVVMHGYSAKDMNSADDTIEVIKDIRNTMASLNLRNKDLVIKEFGPLPSPSIDFTISHMDKIVNFFATAKDTNTGNMEDSNRLVQRWAWFVSSESKAVLDKNPTWRNLILFDQDNNDAITQVGYKYKELIDKYVLPNSTCTIQGYKKVFGQQTDVANFENSTITLTGNGNTITCNTNPCIFDNLPGNIYYTLNIASPANFKPFSTYCFNYVNCHEQINFSKIENDTRQVTCPAGGFTDLWWGGIYTTPVSTPSTTPTLTPNPTALLTPVVSPTPQITPTPTPNVSPTLSDTPTPTISPTQYVLPNDQEKAAIDLQSDGEIDISDFVKFVEYYKTENCLIDYNKNSRCKDISDFVEFVRLYKYFQ